MRRRWSLLGPHKQRSLRAEEGRIADAAPLLSCAPETASLHQWADPVAPVPFVTRLAFSSEKRESSPSLTHLEHDELVSWEKTGRGSLNDQVPESSHRKGKTSQISPLSQRLESSHGRFHAHGRHGRSEQNRHLVNQLIVGIHHMEMEQRAPIRVDEHLLNLYRERMGSGVCDNGCKDQHSSANNAQHYPEKRSNTHSFVSSSGHERGAFSTRSAFLSPVYALNRSLAYWEEALFFR